MLANPVTYAIACAGILGGIALVLRFALTRGGQKSQEFFYVSIVLLALGSAFITGVGRSRFPIAEFISGRYAPVPLLFWIGLAALITMQLCRREPAGGRGAAIWCAFLILASVATFPTHFPLGRYFALRERLQAAAALSIAVGVPDVPRVQRRDDHNAVDRFSRSIATSQHPSAILCSRVPKRLSWEKGCWKTIGSRRRALVWEI